MRKPTTEMQFWARVLRDTKIEWSLDPQDVVLAIGNLPEFEIVGTPEALRRLVDKVSEALQAFEAAHAGQ
ncbi:hypothetical protein [Saccharothrix australiensis]|uniref:Uncharacterized protein n=1 Tax=Saccharothrix australiensis TaxID=2072 RepID=A0A495VT48_9PSEU|nr:hypothetical protein [Saccharothrix australiensis]RKT52512.1 hypothetical protein C8E97_1029 [Saccharothrix australiensis]